jgi:hypothetical protein
MNITNIESMLQNSTLDQATKKAVLGVAKAILTLEKKPPESEERLEKLYSLSTDGVSWFVQGEMEQHKFATYHTAVLFRRSFQKPKFAMPRTDKNVVELFKGIKAMPDPLEDERKDVTK